MKRKKITIDTHHRKARGLGGDNSPKNKIKVMKHHHQAYHLLFFTGNPYCVAKILNDTYLDPAYKLVVVKVEELEEFSGEGIA